MDKQAIMYKHNVYTHVIELFMYVAISYSDIMFMMMQMDVVTLRKYVH